MISATHALGYYRGVPNKFLTGSLKPRPCARGFLYSLSIGRHRTGGNATSLVSWPSRARQGHVVSVRNGPSKPSPLGFLQMPSVILLRQPTIQRPDNDFACRCKGTPQKNGPWNCYRPLLLLIESQFFMLCCAVYFVLI